jgi:hypothetical protein
MAGINVFLYKTSCRFIIRFRYKASVLIKLMRIMKFNQDGSDSNTEDIIFHNGNALESDTGVAVEKTLAHANRTINGIKISVAGWVDLKKRIIGAKSIEFYK